MVLVVAVLAACSARSCVRSSSTRAGLEDCPSTRPSARLQQSVHCPSDAAGLAVRSRRDRERELAARTSELAARAGGERRQRGARGAVRIARELHDVVAHHVSVMGVQAGAARRVMASSPRKPRRSSARSRPRAARRWSSCTGCSASSAAPTSPTSSRRSRTWPSCPSSSPRPGRRATVELSIEGEPRALPRTLEVCLSRDPGGADERPQALRRDDPPRCASTTSRRRSRSRCWTTARARRAAGLRRRARTDRACASASACTAASWAPASARGRFAVHATFPLNGPEVDDQESSSPTISPSCAPVSG